jgi:hypothetical protein
LKKTDIAVAALLVHFVLAVGHTLHAQAISPCLFGQNHWMDKSDEGRRPGYLYMLWPKIKESGVESIRIGGGGYERRLPSREKLAAIVENIQRIGAEPILQVPSHYSAEDAGDLVAGAGNT